MIHMEWEFVGRDSVLDDVIETLATPGPPVVVLQGDPGVGRTATAERAIDEYATRHGAAVARIRPGRRHAAFDGLRTLVPEAEALVDGWFRHVSAAADLCLAHLGTAPDRLLVVADDVHAVDDATVAVLDELNHRGVPMLVTRLREVPTPASTECLRAARTVRLTGLTGPEVAALLEQVVARPIDPATADAFHAATAGSPALLRRLLLEMNLVERLVPGEHGLHLAGEPAAWAPPMGSLSPAALRAAADAAWARLDLERAEEICRLAAHLGWAGRMSDIWCGAAMAAGDGERAETIAAAWGDRPRHAEDTAGTVGARLVVHRAVNLAFGLSRPHEALTLLDRAADVHDDARPILLAARSWIVGSFDLPAPGFLSEPVPAPRAPGASAPEVTMLRDTAAGVGALRAGDPGAAVTAFRRASAVAGDHPECFPWLLPYLEAWLIDVQLRAGREWAATSAALQFHDGVSGCGWSTVTLFAGGDVPADGDVVTEVVAQVVPVAG